MSTDDDYLKRILPGVLGQLQRQARSRLYATRPDLWAWDYLGVELWWKQTEIALDVVSTHNIAVKAGHGVGKSYLAGVLICWWIDVHPLGDAFVASTAPSEKQVNAIVWREVRKFFRISHERYLEHKDRVKNNKPLDEFACNDHPLPGYITSDAEWKMSDGSLIGAGRKPPEHMDSAFQGIHARYVLAIGDEACGLPENLIQSLMDITTNGTSRVLLIANPTVPASYLARIFKSNGFEDKATGERVWGALHTISVFDSPNLHGGGKCECHPDEPLGLGMRPETLESLVDEGYIRDKRREYGENSARFKARVQGEFARDEGDNMLFDVEDVTKAGNTTIEAGDAEYIWLGVDVASYGDDSSVIYINWGGHVRKVDEWGGKGDDDKLDILEAAERIDKVARRNAVHEVRIDAVAVGEGAWRTLLRLSVNEDGSIAYVVHGLRGNYASTNLNAWRNGRAEWYDSARRLMRDGSIDIDPDDERLYDELLSIQYFVPETGKGGIQLETKKDMRKRGLKSPDAADAFIYAVVPLEQWRDPSFAQKGDTRAEDPEFAPQDFVDSWFNGAGMPG